MSEDEKWQILRSLGARPLQIMVLLVVESLVLTSTGVLMGFVSTFFLIATLKPIVEAKFGLSLPLILFETFEVTYVLAFLALGFLVSLLPAFRAYRNALADGLSIRI